MASRAQQQQNSKPTQQQQQKRTGTGSSQQSRQEEPESEAQAKQKQKEAPKKKELKNFKFEIACDHTPEFKQVYEMIFKSNLMYMDSEGRGHSYTSEIQGGAAGNGHNNVVTVSTEDTQKAMAFANNMMHKHMQKQASNMQKDSRSYGQKPQVGLFYGQRIYYQEQPGEAQGKSGGRSAGRGQRKADKIVEQKVDQGLLCFLKLKGTVLLDNLLAQRELHHEQSDLAIYPVSIDQTIYQENKKIKHPEVAGGRFQVDADENVAEKFDQNCLECLIGTREGTIYVYDPVLIMKGHVYSYNDTGTPFHKAKRPDIVRWIEPNLAPSPMLQVGQRPATTRSGGVRDLQQLGPGPHGAQKFAVSFEDGCIYIYYKGEPGTTREDYTKQMIQVSSNQGNNQQKDGKNMISKSDVVLKMQKLIEDYDFEQVYNNQYGGPTSQQDRREERKQSEAELLGGAKNGLKECLVHNEDVYHGIITHKSRIYDLRNKHYNYTVAYYSKNDKAINPKLMMRFDCHKINEMQCVKLIEKVGGDDGPLGEQRNQQVSRDEDRSGHQLFSEADELSPGRVPGQPSQKDPRSGSTQLTPGRGGESPPPRGRGAGQEEAGTNKILFLIAACNDHYIRFFNLQALKMSLAFKGKDHNGQPLCFDVSADRQMIAVGFEDDSFITYYLEVKDQGLTIEIIPIMRGVGHRNFVSCLKFDSYFQMNHVRYLLEQSEAEPDPEALFLANQPSAPGRAPAYNSNSQLTMYGSAGQLPRPPQPGQTAGGGGDGSNGSIDMQGIDEVGVEGDTNLDTYKKKSTEEKQTIQNIQNQIKQTVGRGKQPGRPEEINEEMMPTLTMGRKTSSQMPAKQKSMLLKKLATQKKIQEDVDNREYRLVSGSDDGNIFFWNIPHDLINQAKSLQASIQGEKKMGNSAPGRPSLVKRTSVKYGPAFSRKIPEFKPKYELYLTGYAQIQSLLLQNDLLVALDNDNTVSVIRTSFSYPNMPGWQQADDENINHDLPSRKGSTHDYIPSVNQSTGSRVNVDPSSRSQTTSSKGVPNQPMPPKTVTNDTVANETGDDDARARRR